MMPHRLSQLSGAADLCYKQTPTLLLVVGVPVETNPIDQHAISMTMYKRLLQMTHI